MHSKTFILFAMFGYLSCHDNNTYSLYSKNIIKGMMTGEANDTNPYRSIGEIPLPRGGFARINSGDGSFANWLLSIKLKKDKTVFKFNGVPKANQTAQFAVLDLSVGDRDLQQCADAVMRLRAEYLFSVKKYQAIHFTDNNGTLYQFNEPFTNKNLLVYLNRVYGMCGTSSLSKQLSRISFKDIEPGDVIIQGGFPGHAVIVMDVAKNKEGQKIFLLAQSYMPAQDIHVLVNPTNELLSPWYEVNNSNVVETPEYNFTQDELKRW